MLYKHRSKVGHLPLWQSIATHTVFLVCAISGSWYLLSHEFKVSVFNIEDHNVLVMHGFTAYFLVFLFGAVVPTHIKAGWKSRRNRFSGALMVAVMALLLLSGLFLYYGDETRDIALWMHWVIGGGLVLLFPFHFFSGRRTNYLAIKHHKI